MNNINNEIRIIRYKQNQSIQNEEKEEGISLEEEEKTALSPFISPFELFRNEGKKKLEERVEPVALQRKQQINDVTPSWEEVVEFARKNLPMEGQLLMKPDGYAFLKVDDAYIHTLFPKLGLTKKGYREPPYFRSKDSPGAHISVFYRDEGVIPKEIGQTFSFKLKEIVIVSPSKTKSYAVLQVYSPELEKLRKKYGLEGKLHGHEYHISLALKESHFF